MTLPWRFNNGPHNGEIPETNHSDLAEFNRIIQIVPKRLNVLIMPKRERWKKKLERNSEVLLSSIAVQPNRIWCEILGQKATKTAVCQFLKNCIASLLIAVIPITFEEICTLLGLQVYLYLSDIAFFLFVRLIQHFRLNPEKKIAYWLTISDR